MSNSSHGLRDLSILNIISSILGNYFIRKILVGLVTIWVVITVTFFIMRLAPGGPFTGERQLDPAVLANLRHSYGLDLPLWKQYAMYMLNLLHGDLGPSLKDTTFTVKELLGIGLPNSILLGLLALANALIFGVSIGTLAALHHNGWQDYTVMFIAIVGIICPSFVLAPLLTLVFGVNWGILPVAGFGSHSPEHWLYFFSPEYQHGSHWWSFMIPTIPKESILWAFDKHLILPVISLSLPVIAMLARLTRGSMIEVMNANYIRTARAKGLSERRIIVKHALKGALLPVVSVLGPLIAGITTGSVVIEKIYNISGVGRYFVDGALNRDYTLVLGTVVLYSALLISLNTIVDITYGYIDPRIKK